MVSMSASILYSVLDFLFRSILHDRKIFHNHEEFQPERYLEDGKLNPDVRGSECAAFGFGRRSRNSVYSATYMLIISPPGRHLSNDSFYLIVSCLLAVYTSNLQLTTTEIQRQQGDHDVLDPSESCVHFHLHFHYLKGRIGTLLRGICA